MNGSTRKRLIKLAALAGGVVLTCAAIVVAARGVDWSALSAAEPWQIAVLLAAVAGNLLITGLIFWVITLSYDATPRVPARVMFWLIAASALLNYLPLRPGLLGRSAYLKMKYNLPIAQSVMILGIVLALGAGVLLGAGALVLFTPDAWLPIAAGVAAVAATAIVWAVAPLVLRRPIVAGWSWAPLRLVDLAFATLRLWVAFAVIGHAVGVGDAVVLAAAGMLIAMAGLTPNGLGLREWAIAILAGLLGGADATEAAAIAAAAALVDRAAEVVVVAIVGSIAMTRINLAGDSKGESADAPQQAGAGASE